MHRAIVLQETASLESIDLLGGLINVMSDTQKGDEQSVTVQESSGAGFGPPPHSHPWSETFYVLSTCMPSMSIDTVQRLRAEDTDLHQREDYREYWRLVTAVPV